MTANQRSYANLLLKGMPPAERARVLSRMMSDGVPDEEAAVSKAPNVQKRRKYEYKSPHRATGTGPNVHHIPGVPRSIK
jgi:hypothetical protein